jgi:hypothetical protein
MMRDFTCTCDWRFIVGRKRVFGPLFTGPGEHQMFWHVGQMMTRDEFEQAYSDCAYRLKKGLGKIK